MKILMLTPYLPYPPASGGQIRTLNLLKYLSKNNEITLISLYKNRGEKKYSKNLTNYCSRVYACKRAEKPWQFKIITKTILTLKPLLIVRNFSKEANILLEQLLKKETFDVIHAETFYIMPHIPKTEIPIFLVEQTIEYQVYQHFVNSLPFLLQPFFNLDVIKLKYWEKYYWKKATVVSTVSETDKQIILKDEPKINPVIVPNGAGDEMFVEKLSEKNLDNPILLFQGNFSWLQNSEAASYLIEKIYPLIKAQLPNARIIIAGQQTKKIKIKNKSPIELVEFSQDNTMPVKEIYRQATLFIAPIFGPGGTRLKILAAMASGLPVVSTTTGIEGLEVVAGKHVLVADTPREFVDQIKFVLNNKKKYDEIRINAYKLAKQKYSWSSITKKLEVIYKKIAKK